MNAMSTNTELDTSSEDMTAVETAELSSNGLGFWTIGKKLVAVVAVGVILGLTAVIMLQADAQRTAMTRASEQANYDITALLAAQVGGGIRFKKAEKVTTAYDRLVSVEGSTVVAIASFTKDGQLVSSYQSEHFAPVDLSTMPEVAASVIEFSEIATKDHGGYHLIVAPSIFGKKNETVGVLAVAWDFTRLENDIGESVVASTMIAAGITLAMIIAIALIIRTLVGSPLTATTGVMQRLADGDLEVRIFGADRSDELGQMAKTVRVFRENARERVRLVEAEEFARQQREQEAEQQRHEQEIERQQLMADLADDFEKSVGAVVDSVTQSSAQMKTSAQNLLSLADTASSQAGAAAAASDSASNNVQAVASASEELAASITEISGQVSRAATATSEAEQEVTSTSEKVQTLSESADRIGEVVALITDIAEQTNLLALNATIEAARAGDAGKGFAVVASEVKNLANQTAKATEQIASQIGGIQSATSETVEAIQSIGKRVTSVAEISTSIAAAVEEQSSATQEIARNAEQASSGTTETSSNVAGVSEATTGTGSASNEMLTAADDLGLQAETLRNQVDQYLIQVRGNA